MDKFIDKALKVSKEIRYYQQDCKDAVEKALSQNIKAQLVVMPGGCGKTFTAVNIIKDKGRKLWITHEESLLEQSAIALLIELDLMPEEVLRKTIEDNDGLIELLIFGRNREYDLDANETLICENIGLVKADYFDIDKPIVMSSAQTLHNRLSRIPIDHFKVIVVDEADLFFSKTFIAPIRYFSYDLLLGLTATPFRMDGVMMDDIFDSLVYEYTIQQAIKDGYLCEINGIVIKTSTDLDSVHTIGGDFNQKELTEKCNNPVRNNQIVNKYIEYCSGQQFICFGVDVQHAIDLAFAFNEKGIKTEFIVSDVNLTPDRKGAVKRFREEKIIGLCNVGILTAGFDHPNTGCVILGRPTKSKRLFLQQLFRVTRLKGADFVKRFGQIGTVLDVVDGTTKHNLVNTHELDKGLPIEERVFLSSENRSKLIDAREERKKEREMVNVKVEKRVTLFPLPRIRAKFGDSQHRPINSLQEEWLRKRKYDTVNNSYTEHQFNTLFFNSPASSSEVEILKAKGFNVSLGVTKGQYIHITEGKI